MSAVRVLQPDLRVTLYKLVDRTTVDGNNSVAQRYTRTGRAIDITRYFSDMGSITTQVRQAASGFSLTFSDPRP